jgi:hypothetical protein
MSGYWNMIKGIENNHEKVYGVNIAFMDGSNNEYVGDNQTWSTNCKYPG